MTPGPVRCAQRSPLDAHSSGHNSQRPRIIDRFSDLAIERVWGEFEKIFSSIYPSRALDVLIKTGWIVHFPELAAIIGIVQDPVWHPEGSVEIHSGLAADAAAELANRLDLETEQRVLLVCASLLHDLGKATHTQVHDDGRVTAHGHAEAGVEPAQSFLRRIGAPLGLSDKVAPLVREHMCCASTEKPSVSAVKRLARRLSPASMREWAWVVEADNRARATASRQGCAGPWLEIAEREQVQDNPVTAMLRGDHLIAFGMRPGPDFRPVLDDALTAQEAGEFDDEVGARHWLNERLSNG